MTELEKVQAERERAEKALSEIRSIMSISGMRVRTPEEIEESRKKEAEQKRARQEWLKENYKTGQYQIYKRICPVCYTVFYTTNRQQKYDDYYKCAPKAHRQNAKDKRYINRNHVCEMCGKYFEPTRAGAKYCCNACRQKAYRKRYK